MTIQNESGASALLKLWRFFRLYGVARSLFKVAGRVRRPFRLIWRPARVRDAAMIGCGQFAFSTIGFFVARRFGARFAICYDADERAALSFARAYNVPLIALTPTDAICSSEVKYVYIASNHASHSEYARQAIRAGKVVYVEKPISVSYKQFQDLIQAVREAPCKIFAGYNRPFSGAIAAIKSRLSTPRGPLTLSCFVSGHLIGPDHWYRNPEEGTRICGNAGHWIDLFVHLMSLRSLPSCYDIQILSGSADEPDDNFVLAIATSEGDVFSLLLTSRTEPFEGINETINFQCDNIIAKIDDFRQLTLWQGEKLIEQKFWPKDVGHRAAVLQPFDEHRRRDWAEVEVSTLLMLRIAEMVTLGQRRATFEPSILLKS